MLTAIATSAFCSLKTRTPRRLPKQVTDFVARTDAGAAVGEFLQRWGKSSTGIRPGEKLYEELSTSDEEACPLDASDLSKAMRDYARISLLLVTVFNSNGDTKVIPGGLHALGY